MLFQIITEEDHAHARNVVASRISALQGALEHLDHADSRIADGLRQDLSVLVAGSPVVGACRDGGLPFTAAAADVLGEICRALDKRLRPKARRKNGSGH